MGKASKELNSYIRSCLNNGYSYRKIEDVLVNKGYPKKVAEGAILSYKHRGILFKWFAISFLLIIFSGSIYLTGSGIIGMVTLDYARSFSDDLGIVANSSSFYSWYPSIKGEIFSIAVTGNVIGNGNTKIFVENNDNKYLIFDSSIKNYKVTDISSKLLSNQKIKHFDYVCEDTCSLIGFNKSIYNIVFEVEDSTLELEKIHFDVLSEKQVIDMPRFLEIPSQIIKINSVLKINLSSYFNSTEENVGYGYIAEDNSINVIINDEGIAKISSDKEGSSYIYFTAKISGIQFMSNLVEIDFRPDDGSLPAEKVVKGDFVKEGEGLLSPSTDNYLNNSVYLLVIVIALAIISLMIFVPSRYYSMSYLADRLESVRKGSTLSKDIDDYEKIKSVAKIGNLSNMDEKKIVAMENKVREISLKVPQLKVVKEFNEKAIMLENSIQKNYGAAKVYDELRDIYLKIVKSKVREKDKKIFFKRIQKYYKMVKALKHK
jgi:hypothetical protein